MPAPFTVEPFVVHVGPLELTGFGVAMAAAFAIAHVTLRRELARRGHHAEADATPDVVTAAVLGTLVGGKLYSVVLNGDLATLWSRTGFVFWGGFMGAVLCCWAVIRRKRLSFARIADAAGIGIAAGYAVGRTGCFAVGDDYGRPWDGPLAVTFPRGFPPSTAENMARQFGAQLPPGTLPGDVIAVHPTQLYETAMGFAMFLVLWRLRDHRHAAGWLFGVYCVLAGVERFVVEFFRAKDDRFVGPLSSAQAVALAVGLLGVALLWLRRGDGGGVGGDDGRSMRTAAPRARPAAG